jgi:hypothetical protein
MNKADKKPRIRRNFRVVIDYDNGEAPLLVGYALSRDEAKEFKARFVSKGYDPSGIWVEEYTLRDYRPVWGKAYRIYSVSPRSKELLFSGLMGVRELNAALAFCKGIAGLKVESYDQSYDHGKPLEEHYGFNSQVDPDFVPSGKGLRYKVPEQLHFTVLGHGVPQANRWHADNYNPYVHGKLGNVLPKVRGDNTAGLPAEIINGEHIELTLGQVVERVKSQKLLTHPKIIRSNLKEMYYLKTAHGYFFRMKAHPAWNKVSDKMALKIMGM